MNSTSKEILDKEMTISEIEKKFNVPTDRAVRLFCQATGARRPNSDKLDLWSKQMLKKAKSKSAECSSGNSCSSGGSCSDSCCSDNHDSDWDGGCCGGCGK